MFKDEVDLPFSFGAGAALTLPGLILTGDFRRTDWREIDFAGLLRFRGEDAYRATTSWHLGAEWYLPWAPIRLRAGYQDDPLPYLMLPDFTGADPLVFAEIDDDRSFWSIGAGFLVSDHLTVDLALMRGDFRRSTEIYVEEVEESRLLVSAGYRN
jgi:long-subunit fatty acid transport protein